MIPLVAQASGCAPDHPRRPFLSQAKLLRHLRLQTKFPPRLQCLLPSIRLRRRLDLQIKHLRVACARVADQASLSLHMHPAVPPLPS
jgi:hypothetical protein